MTKINRIAPVRGEPIAVLGKLLDPNTPVRGRPMAVRGKPEKPRVV